MNLSSMPFTATYQVSSWVYKDRPQSWVEILLQQKQQQKPLGSNGNANSISHRKDSTGFEAFLVQKDLHFVK